MRKRHKEAERRFLTEIQKQYVKEFADAQNHLGILWTNTPYVPGRAFVKLKNWHKADINLFYQNIRENAVQRVQTFLSQK
jgi:hypothetical protein